MKLLIALLLLLHASMSTAKEWTCRNQDMEISCSNEHCEIAKEFTPMTVTFNHKGAMSICAYSGCWEGRGTIFKSEPFTTLVGHKLRFSTAKSDEMNSDFVITFDEHNNILVLLGHGYAMPLTCH